MKSTYTSSVLILPLLIGCAHNVSKDYSLSAGSGKSVIYGKMQYTTNEKESMTINIVNETTGKKLMVVGNNNSSIREFVLEVEPGIWKIEGYNKTFHPSLTPVKTRPQLTGNKNVDAWHDQEVKEYDRENQMNSLNELSEQAAKSKNVGGRDLYFEVTENKVVYVGSWDVSLEGDLTVKNEKEMDDLILSEDYKNLDPKQAITVLPTKKEDRKK